MAERYVLCRRDVGEIGERPRRYCAKAIAQPNDLNWCEEHRRNLPMWPQ